MTSTAQNLLADYVTNGSEQAFRELVRSYLDLVYSTALRLVDGDAHRAEDVAQSVFADLAHKARTLPGDVMLGGWLHRHTCFVACKVMRGERRRQFRERQAVEMNALEDHSEENLAPVWPVLDEAINELGAEDRTAILLRFFEQHDLRSVGAALGSSENAAQKRVARALEELRGLLGRRGVAFSTTTLGAALATQAVTAAPAGLVAGISASALTGTVVGAGTTITLLESITMTKLKVGVLSALAVACVVTPVAIHRQAALRAENLALLRQVQEPVQPAIETTPLLHQARSDRADVGGLASHVNELARLQGDVDRMRQTLAEMKTPSNLYWLSSNAQAMAYAQAVQEGILLNEEELKAGFPKELWVFSGYATPKATAQSLMWALHEGNADALFQSYTPKALQWKLDHQWKDRSKSEIAESMREMIKGVTAFRVMGQNLDPRDTGKVELWLSPQGGVGIPRQMNVTMVKVSHEWKCANEGLGSGKQVSSSP